MKRRIRGFTLIECLIALFILAVSSLLLVQAYTQLVLATRENYTLYNSIGQQMADAENPAIGEGKTSGVKSKMIAEGKTLHYTCKMPDGSAGKEIYEEVHVYVVSPYDMQGNQLSDGWNQGTSGNNAPPGTDTRYLYFHK